MSETKTVDVLVVGGGINGVGIARDAAGRGLSVVLCEKDDLAEGIPHYHTQPIRLAAARVETSR